jgi:hypothetical protein
MEPSHGWRSVWWVLEAASLPVLLPLDRTVRAEPLPGWRSVWWVLEAASLIIPFPLNRAVRVEPSHGWRSVWWVLEAASPPVLIPLDRAVRMEPSHGWRSVWWVLELAIGIPPPDSAGLLALPHLTGEPRPGWLQLDVGLRVGLGGELATGGLALGLARVCGR